LKFCDVTITIASNTRTKLDRPSLSAGIS